MPPASTPCFSPHVGIEGFASLADHLLVVAVGPDVLPAFAHDDGGAGVLASRQDHPRGDVGVLEELERDEAIVVGSLGIFEDVGELLQVPGPQQVRDVGHRLLRDVSGSPRAQP